MNQILDRIKSGDIIVADGAMGSLLFKKGLEKGDCPEKLNLSNPEILEEIAKLYIDAGSEIIQTNTFGASSLKLAEYNLHDKTEEINIKGVRAVRNVVGDKAYVSGSCGPSGKILQPYGDATPEELMESYKIQMSALVEGGVDLICIETMIDVNEAVVAIQAARDISKNIPVTATMTFDKTPRGFYTIMGTSIEQAVESLSRAGADIIGSNCGNGLEKMIEIAGEFKKVTEIPIIIQSNAGLPEIVEGNLVYNETADFFGDRIGQLIDIGVSIIGGCCGTTPEHIRAIKRVVDARNN